MMKPKEQVLVQVEDPDNLIEQEDSSTKEKKNCCNIVIESCMKNKCLTATCIALMLVIAGMIFLVVRHVQLSERYTNLANEEKLPNFKLINGYYVDKPIPKNAGYWTYFAMKKQKCIELPAKDDFWSDKLKMAQCFNGVQNGVEVIPTLWASRQWEIAEKDALKAKLTELFAENPAQEYILKPAHMTEGLNIIHISKDRFEKNWNEILGEVAKIPMTEKAWKEFMDKKKWIWEKGIPGLILQEKMKISEHDDLREIKINVVWGKVVSFKYWYFIDKHRTELEKKLAEYSVMLNVDERDHSRSCYYWDPNRPTVKTKNWSKAKNKVKCDFLEKMMDWDIVIPRIEQFAAKLHVDFLRIDIFPRDNKTSFYINEVEITSASYGNFNDPALKKIKQYSNALRESKNPEKYHLDPKLHDFHCTVFDTPYVPEKAEDAAILNGLPMP